jgi:hypothetical protein
MMFPPQAIRLPVVVICCLAALASGTSMAADPVPSLPPPADNVLSPLQQRQTEQAVDQALAWLASQQDADGSFRTLDRARTGVTGLCVLAFLSRGHLPGEGRYGEHISRGIQFLLAGQTEHGLLSNDFGPGTGQQDEKCAVYNHPIAGLTLCEAYGMVDRELSQKIKPVIERARDYTLRKQAEPKIMPQDRGGWRYRGFDAARMSDLSVTSWYLLFLRSAKNAGIATPLSNIDMALDYVERSYEPRRGVFIYIIDGGRPITRAMVGAGILSISLAGKHNTDMARAAGDWLLTKDFGRYGETIAPNEHYAYGVFYCAQGMFQLGGKHWSGFYPRIVKAFLENQDPSGAWPARGRESEFGNVYTTALCVLALDTPYQLLPIFQR